MIGHGLFASEPKGNLFHLHAIIFEIPKKCFVIEPPARWGTDVSIEIYEFLLLFSIITPWLYQLVQKLNDVNRYLYFSDSIEFKIIFDNKNTSNH